jgi:transposase
MGRRRVVRQPHCTLRDLARRWKTLDAEIKTLNKPIASLVTTAAPDLVELHGVGVEIAGQFLVTAGDNAERIKSEAAFAKLCGVAPQPDSSGRTSGRHRLSRGGDRAANSALYIITIVRIGSPSYGRASTTGGAIAEMDWK